MVISEGRSLLQTAREQIEVNEGSLGLVNGKVYGMYASMGT